MGKLQAGGAGEIGVKAANKHALRKRGVGESPKSQVVTGTISLDSDLSIQEQLRNLLTANSVRVIDLFRQWDDDDNGTIDKKEFRKAITALGFKAPKPEIDALFDTFDTDRSGE